MAALSSLFILANLTRKVVHSKTGHTFLLYSTVDSDSDSDSCTIDVTLVGPEEDEDAPLGRWWTATWSEAELMEIGVSDNKTELISFTVQLTLTPIRCLISLRLRTTSLPIWSRERCTCVGGEERRWGSKTWS